MKVAIKLITLGYYCQKCQQEHNLPECANFLFHSSLCEVCQKPAPLVFFSGGCCILKKR